MKLHHRVVRAGRREYQVLSPRPRADLRFSTNYFHETWHILSDWRGARLLGRLLWGLAFAKVPGTVVVIDRPFLDPNPFDSAPVRPILLVPAQLTPLTHKSAAELRRALPQTPVAGTVRWQTHGLDAVVAARGRERDPSVEREPYVAPPGPDRMALLGGFVTFTASPGRLREYAPYVYRLCESAWHGMAYAEVAWPDGEVQVFRDYRPRVSAARVARREIGSRPDAPTGGVELDRLLWRRGTEARQRGRFRPSPPVPEPQPPAVPAATPYGRPVTG